jgi:hypothetical protein
VLVQVLARSDAEEEAPIHEGGRRGGGLGDDRGVDADRRTRDGGAETEPRRRLRDGPGDRPHERALPLAIAPWVEVIRDEREAEARLLRPLREADQIGRAELLARELVADLDHRRPLCGIPPLGAAEPSMRIWIKQSVARRMPGDDARAASRSPATG